MAMRQDQTLDQPSSIRARVIGLHAELCACGDDHCAKNAVIADALYRAVEEEQHRCARIATAEARRCAERRDGAGRSAAQRIREAIVTQAIPP
jgi:hypothetical protein